MGAVGRHPGAPKRVLVLEESSELLEEISQFLSAQGFLAIGCRAIADAMGGRGVPKMDIIVFDIQLPGAGGMDGIRRLRNAWPDARIIAMSTAEDLGPERDNTLVLARRFGADAVIQKPFSLGGLRTKINYILEMEAAHRTGQPRVMVVDDARTIRLAVRRMLVEAGYIPFTAESMEDALDSLEIVGMDVLLTDIFMPGKGGLAGITNVREAWPYVRIIAMSAGLNGVMEGSTALRAAERIGADATIGKPFTKEMLTRVIEQVLGT